MRNLADIMHIHSKFNNLTRTDRGPHIPTESLVNSNVYLGIEVEAEFKNRYIPPFLSSPLVYSEHDGSLRNGSEYLFTRPLKGSCVTDALNGIGKIASMSECVSTYRCSTHVHLNATDLTLRDIYHVLMVYALVEPTLSRLYRETRQNNPFAFSMDSLLTSYFDVERLLKTAKAAANGGRRLALEEEACNSYAYFDKYSSLNLTSLSTYGSLEFRIFPFFKRNFFEKTLRCVNLILDIREVALKYSSDELITATYEMLSKYYAKLDIVKNESAYQVLSYMYDNSTALLIDK